MLTMHFGRNVITVSDKKENNNKLNKTPMLRSLRFKFYFPINALCLRSSEMVKGLSNQFILIVM